MTSKHTPGPWSYQEWGRLILDSGQGSSRLQVATVALNTRRDEGTANARLIAAAPELLAAALLIVETIEGGPTRPADAISAIRAAIAKATGEA